MIKQRLKFAKEGNANWRTEAALCFKFIAGTQWDEDEKPDEPKPAITFNRSDVFVDAICGMEVNNRQSIHAFPREINDAGVNEVLNAGIKYVREQTDAESEESESFRDATVCGVAATRSRMDYSEDAEGKFVEERVDPLQLWPDPAAKKKCLRDMRYFFHGEYMDRDEAHRRWPDAILSSDAPELETVVNTDTNWLYKDEENNIYESKDKVFVFYYEEVRKETYYKALNPITNKIEEITKDVYDKIGDKLSLKAVKMQKNVYYRAFLNAEGEELDKLEKSPIQEFTYKFITYKRDRAQGCWYGIVRHMIEPQKWANKWLSQSLHIMNSNAKGGVIAEAGAFADPRKAEEQWAEDSPFILAREGAVSQGKIKERVPAPYPAGFDKLMMFAFDALNFVTGVNLEILGLANREQAGVLEDQRRQSAFAILAPLFDSLRQYRKDQGKLTLRFISEFYKGRLVRIVGQNGAVQYVPMAVTPEAQTFDVIVDQSPDSPDFKKQLWEMLQVMLPAMMKAGYPIPPSVIKYIPNLPLDLAQEWINHVQQSSQGPSPEQMQQMQEQMQKMGEENQKLKEDMMNMKMDNTIDVLKLQQKSQEAIVDANLKNKQIESEAAARQMEIMIDAQIERMNMVMEAKIKMAQAMMDAQIKAWSAEMKSENESKKIESEGQKQEKAPITFNLTPNEDMKGLMDQHTKTLESLVTPIADKVEGLQEEVKKKPRKRKIKRVADGYEVEDLA